jgi:transposase
VEQGEITVEKSGQYLTPFQHKLLLKSLEMDLRPEYRRRIEIMLLANAGASQTEICKTLGCSPETARYWIDMARLGRALFWSDRPMGRPKSVNEQYLDRLQELVSHSPRDYDYPFRRWTAQWLSKHLAKELGIEVSACHINRLLKQMGLSTRPKPATEETASDRVNFTIGNLASTGMPEHSEIWALPLLR